MNSLIFLDFFILSLFLFFLGVWGILVIRTNIIIILLSIELMLFSINLNFILFSVYLDDILGQIFALLILTVAAAESAIGLAILVIHYRISGIISIGYLIQLKG
jgi:NADH:ubiquinone oxidoreductase subunit K